MAEYNEGDTVLIEWTMKRYNRVTHKYVLADPPVVKLDVLQGGAEVTYTYGVGDVIGKDGVGTYYALIVATAAPALTYKPYSASEGYVGSDWHKVRVKRVPI